MSADVSPSLNPNGIRVTATSSLDGVLLSCSEDVTSLTELMATSFDTLDLTLQPTLFGTSSAPCLLEQSVHFTLLSHEPTEAGLRLIYQRKPKN